MDSSTRAVVITESGVEFLLVACETKAKRQIERIGDVHDVVGKCCKVSAILEISVISGAEIVQSIKPREGCEYI